MFLDRGKESRKVEDLDRCSGVEHVLDDVQPVTHGTRGAVSFRQHEAIAWLQLVESLGEFSPPGETLAGRLALEDELAPECLQCLTLALEILRFGADPGIGDQPFGTFCCMTHK